MVVKMNSCEIQVLDMLVEEFNKSIDEFAKFKITPDTPLHTFQQSIIGHVQRYRESKKLEDEG